jgi:hypothetical protein
MKLRDIGVIHSFCSKCYEEYEDCKCHKTDED